MTDNQEDIMSFSRLMKRWDQWRKYIAGGGTSSWPRDEFEELIEELNELRGIAGEVVNENFNQADLIARAREACKAGYIAKEKSSNEEYLYRNLLVAKALGVEEDLNYILEHLSQLQTAPKWLSKSLERILQNVLPLSKELAKYRNTSKGFPF